MIYKSKEIQLKDGRTALFRSPKEEDAAKMAEYLKTAAGETNFILRYPEECTETVEEERKFLMNILESETAMMIVCEVDGAIAGNCQLMFKPRIKVRHRASVAIALLKPYWNLGIGTKLFEEMIAAAKEHGVTQLELEFIEGNTRARRLYEKMGFRIIAERPNAIRLKDGTMLKEFIMIKELC